MTIRALPSAAFMLVPFLPLMSTAQDIWFVDDDGNPGTGCTSWEDACPELQTALSLAEAGDQIWVAQGLYRPDYDVDADQHTGDRAATFQLINGVEMYGGFEGTETALRDRAGLFDQTILSGDLNGDDDSRGDNGENSYHVVTGSGTDESAILNGFTLTRGNANGINPFDRGGGFYSVSGSAILSHCTVRNNSANLGGGLQATFSSTTVSHCVFSSNSASDHGGAMFFSIPNDVLVSDSTISGNTANGYGGGIFSNTNQTIVINCTFDGNLASGGGGMGNGTALNCTFNGNTASVNGGGMRGGTATNCIFSSNIAPDGGGMMKGMALGCLFIDNTALDFGGGKFNTNDELHTAMNCVFVANVASEGGGMYSGAATNCTFTGNTAATSGGGIGGSALVINGILWSNTPDQISFESIANYSNVEGSFPGKGNINIDPLFVKETDHDLHLSPGSPCIDAGDNTAVPPGVETDLDGNSRFIEDPDTPDTGNPDGINPIVDMGAYEFNCIDDDGDGVVTICHMPPGNAARARTISVRVNAVPAHLAHGDECGACE